MGDRIQRMQSDVNELAVKILEHYSSGDEIRELYFDEGTLRFQIRKEAADYREVSICFSEDYPDGTVIWGLEGINPGRMTAEEAFTVAVGKLELSCTFSNTVAVPDAPTGHSVDQNNETAPKKTRLDSPPLTDKTSLQATESDTANKSMACDPNPVSDGEGEYESDAEPWNESVEVHEALRNDIRYCQDALGNGDACRFYHESPSLETAHVVLRIPFESVEDTLVEAWGLTANEPICIQLSDISVVHYRMTAVKPTIKVMQGNGANQRPSVCLRQLQRIIEKYLRDTWTIQDDRDYGNRCILLSVCLYAAKRLRTLCDHCVICDKEHELTAMFMPSVCNRDLCVFSYETMGVMADFDVRFTPQIEVIDLLVKMFCAAVTSYRHELILVPFPSIPDPEKKEEMAISDSKEHYAKLAAVTMKIPCTRTMRELDDGQQSVIDELRKIDPLLFPLMRWTFASNRAYLMKLPASDRLEFLGTSHQYLMMLDSPAKEAAFREAKTNRGESIFAFHGSPFDNWHSILRRGLINASGTPLQLVGTAYGKGIYLSPKLHVSAGYACRHSVVSGMPRCEKSGWIHDCTESGRFLDSNSVPTCVALCEVISTSELRKATTDIWVQSNADLVCTRFFLVYDKGYIQSSTVDCTNPETLAKIREAVDKFRKLMAG